MGELKPGWKRYRFSDMVTSAGATRKSRGWNIEEAGVDRYVGLEHLDSNSLPIRRWGDPRDVGENSDLRHFEVGDVLLARRGIDLRKVGRAHFRGVASGHALVFRAMPQIVLPEFLPFFIQSDVFMARADRRSMGSLSKTVNLSALMKQEFALPPLEEQRRIARVMSHFEANINAKEQLLSRLRVVWESLVNQPATLATGSPRFSKTKRLAGGLRLLSLRDVCSEIVDCLHRTPDYQSVGIPAVRTSDVSRDGRLKVQGMKRVPDHEYAIQTSRLEPREGDLLFTREAPMGHCGIVPPNTKLCISQRMMHLRLRSEFVPKYIWAQLNSVFVRDQVSRFGVGSTVKHINVPDVGRLLVLVPSLDEQMDFARRFEEVHNRVETVSERLDSEKAAFRLEILPVWS